MAKLTAKEMESLLKACARAGVSRLKMPGLEVEFRGAVENAVKKSDEGGTLEESGTLESVEAQGVAQGELEIREDQVETLLIADPVEFEQRLVQGELEEDEAPQARRAGTHLQ